MRREYQCRADWPGGAFFFDRESFEFAARDWSYPLHFIDCENCAVAILFGCGRRGEPRRPGKLGRFVVRHRSRNECSHARAMTSVSRC
jgi:hypothetical protein